MKRIVSILLALCLLLTCTALFAGCSDEKGKDYPVTIGYVTIDKEPQNIVVLNDDFADIISYIGYDIKMVGRSVECDQDFLYVVPTVGSAAAPDVAAITAAETDLVIADSTLSAPAKQSLEDAGVKVLTLQPAQDEEQLKQLYATLGTALGGNVTGEQKGEEGYDSLMDMLSKLNSATSSVVQTAAYLYLDGSGQLCTFVKGTLAYKFFNYNGCTNVFINQDEPQVNTAELRIGSPTYIFYDSEEVLSYLAADESLQGLNALVNDHTCQLALKNFSRHGATAEETVFEMLNYIEKLNKATPDEPTQEATEAPTEKPTEAPTEAPATEAEEEAAALTAEETPEQAQEEAADYAAY